MNKPIQPFEVVLVGQPNAGKSTIFNVLSDIKTHVSNFSGTSVDIAETSINIYNRTVHVVDLPGVYSLNPGDEAEKITFQYLSDRRIDLIINVVDASMLSRSLELSIELMEFGLPMVIALNMVDDAERKGVKLFPEKLEERLNIPVVPTSALYGKGIKELSDTCGRVLFRKQPEIPVLTYTSHVEHAIRQIESCIRDIPINPNGSHRFYAIKTLETPEIVPPEMIRSCDHLLDGIRNQIQDMHHRDVHETISYERHHLAMKLMEETSRFIDRKTVPFREKLDRYFLHPILGYFPLAVFFFLFFVLIYFSGRLLENLIAAPLDQLPRLYQGLKAHFPFLWYTVDGIHHGIDGALGIVLPYFIPLIFLTSIFEDTGYLSRIAFLMDGLMHKIGLHGKSVAPFIMGFGCTVPALYNIRIIENKRERDLTAILLPFIPCTARTSIILALTAAFTGPLGALFVYVFIMLVIGVTGALISLFMGKPTGLIMEIPDLKIPSFKVSAGKTWYKMKGFLSFALPFLIIGSIVMAWMEYASVNQFIDRLLAPFMRTVLGLDPQLGSTLIYGFFRKELVPVMAKSAFSVYNIVDLPLSKGQILVFIIFVTLYFPCLSTFVVMWKEFGKRIVLFSSLLSVAVAAIAAFLVRIALV
ncbi:MAG: ferrous iron transport protein B [Candidatus Omnitrophota bacterium]